MTIIEWGDLFCVKDVEDFHNRAIDVDDFSEPANEGVIYIEDSFESTEKIQDGNGSSSCLSSSDEEEKPTTEKGSSNGGRREGFWHSGWLNWTWQVLGQWSEWNCGSGWEWKCWIK